MIEPEIRATTNSNPIADAIKISTSAPAQTSLEERHPIIYSQAQTPSIPIQTNARHRHQLKWRCKLFMALTSQQNSDGRISSPRIQRHFKKRRTFSLLSASALSIALFGLKAPVVKTHGSSDAKAVYSTIRQIRTMLETDVVGKSVVEFSDAKE